ncbi:MAG: acyltransferase [Desulfobacterales bacterium]
MNIPPETMGAHRCALASATSRPLDEPGLLPDAHPAGRRRRPDRLAWLPGPVRALLSAAVYIGNTLVWTLPLLGIALLKWLFPLQIWRRFCDRLLNGIAGGWISVNNLNLRLMNRIRWVVDGVEGVQSNGWHLVVANHQSWVDILVLQKIFHRRIPFLKFFLKKELIWVPVLGLAWWALDFPFVKRYSKAKLSRRPHLRGKDIAITRKACRKFKTIPVSIMNFVEGSRFSPEKREHQQSPYRHLLKPKSGGVALVLATLGDRIDTILDVTIVYPGGAPRFWDLLCGRIDEVRVCVQPLEVPEVARTDENGNPRDRKGFQEWLNDMWKEKDRLIDGMLEASASTLL